MMMTNGVGATVGTLCAQEVINHYVYNLPEGTSAMQVWSGWQHSWYVFAIYSLVIAILFTILFRYKQEEKK